MRQNEIGEEITPRDKIDVPADASANAGVPGEYVIRCARRMYIPVCRVSMLNECEAVVQNRQGRAVNEDRRAKTNPGQDKAR